MATLILTANATCAISLNGGFMGILYPDKEITAPLPRGETFFCATPLSQSLSPINCLLTNNNQPQLSICQGKLFRWNGDIYQLYFDFKEEPYPPPPVIIKEKPWSRGYVGLCGSYLVYEAPEGSRCHYPEPVDDFFIFSQDCVLAKKENVLIPLNRSLEPFKEIIPCKDFNIQDNRLKTTFTPGDMDFFTVEQIFDADLNLVSTKILEENCVSVFDTLRLFCQSVRLNIFDTTSKFLTPSLKAEMDLNSIKEFLGIFDQTDRPRYLSHFNENTVALRYKIDQSNFHYMCYEFSVSTTTDTILIDDISEL